MKIPGLIDLQVNGYKGVDFSSGDLTRQSFMQAAREITSEAATAFLATVITSSREIYRQNLQIIAEVMALEEFRGRILGVHLEGPFISAQDGARGAHQAAWVQPPSIDLLDELLDWAGENVRLLTIAAELENAEKLARYAVSRGIAVSLGHQLAGEKDIYRLSQAGASALTHLGNGIPAMIPRFENPIWAGLANDDLTAMMITDGHHLPPSLIKTILRVKTPRRCIVTSDSAPLAGMPMGFYRTLGNAVVLCENGRLFNPETGYLVGSSATMLQCMNYLAALQLVDIDGMIMMAYYNPLQLINLQADKLQPLFDVGYDQETGRFGII